VQLLQTGRQYASHSTSGVATGSGRVAWAGSDKHGFLSITRPPMLFVTQHSRTTFGPMSASNGHRPFLRKGPEKVGAAVARAVRVMPGAYGTCENSQKLTNSSRHTFRGGFVKRHHEKHHRVLVLFWSCLKSRINGGFRLISRCPIPRLSLRFHEFRRISATAYIDSGSSPRKGVEVRVLFSACVPVQSLTRF
jgi:hypothetical protein